MIDIHSHIISGIDDGAKDIAVSKQMLKIASMSGTKQIIATPHYIRGCYENKYSDILVKTKELNECSCLNEEGIKIKVLPGQEVMTDDHTIELFNQGIIGTLNGTKYMLVEFPMYEMPKCGLEILYELSLLGVKPIMAHPERYEYIIKRPANINDFLTEGLLYQINSGSIMGVFGGEVKRTAEILIRHGICNFIASDAHSILRRKPVINEAMDIAEGYSKGLKQTLIKNCKGMLDNDHINEGFEKIKENKIFSLLTK